MTSLEGLQGTGERDARISHAISTTGFAVTLRLIRYVRAIVAGVA